jgi:zinc protease
MKARFKKCLGYCVLLVWAGISQNSFALPDIQNWETPNGTRVFFVAAPEIPIVDVRIVFDAGSARDGGKLGVAALTNYNVNEGAGNQTADQLAESFESLGANFSHDIDRDLSTFSVRSLADSALLQPALDTLALILSKPSFPEAGFKRVQQQTLGNLEHQAQQPTLLGSLTYYQTLFGQHPYANPTEGTIDSINALTIDDIKQFYKRFYVAKNAVIAIVGAIDRAKAEEIAKKLVVDLPKGETAPALATPTALNAVKQIHIEHPSVQTHVLIGQMGVSRDHPDYFPLYVGNYTLGGGGFVSRLMDQVREKRGLVYHISSYLMPLKLNGIFLVNLQTRNDQAAQEILSRILLRMV